MKKTLLLAALGLGLMSVGASAQTINQNNPVNVAAVVRVGGGPVNINQTGTANVAGVVQVGATTAATVRQTGAVNSATVVQAGYPTASAGHYSRSVPVGYRYHR